MISTYAGHDAGAENMKDHFTCGDHSSGPGVWRLERAGSVRSVKNIMDTESTILYFQLPIHTPSNSTSCCSTTPRITSAH